MTHEIRAHVSPIATLLAGMLVLCPDPCQSGPKNAPPAVARPAVVTWKIPGRALDAEGRPVAGATVYLSREDGEADQFAEPIVIAQTLTQADGRFELTPLESEVKKELADPPAVFGVWDTSRASRWRKTASLANCPASRFSF